MEIRTFVEPIAYWKGPEDSDHIDILIDYFYKLKEQNPDTKCNSSRHGWQMHDLTAIKDEEMSWLGRMILDKFMLFLEEFKPTTIYYATLSNLFVNIQPPGAFNVSHTHPGCQFSGVFYLQGGEDCGNLTVFNPMAVSALSENFGGFPNVEGGMIFPPVPNTGVFFSSKIIHHVDINRSDHDRISVAFNIRINDFKPN
jgi:uncharacterized protein (TIGR02466 family)